MRPPLETPTGKLLGVAHFQRLLQEPPSTLVSSVMDRDLEPVRPEAPLAKVTRSFAIYNLVALPVVDDARRLLGAVTADDVIDHMLGDDWRERPETDEGRAQMSINKSARRSGPRLDQPWKGDDRCALHTTRRPSAR